jgi:alpha-galactosidase
MPKVSIIGAGSMVFATQLIQDILLTPGLETGTFALIDIDNERLELTHQMAELLIARTSRGWRAQASTDRTQILSNSDFVINTIEVAGLENVRHDYDIPLKYGIDQCIGDTIGPGGLFKALRTLPAWLEILADVAHLAPNSLVLNYTNPMSLTVLTGLRASSLPIVGLCHSVQGTSRRLASYLDIPYEKLNWRLAGINHQAWFTELMYDGKDMYPLLKERASEPEIYEQDPVRFEILMHLGYFQTESSGHASEYTAYFRKRPDLIKKYDRTGYRGESGFYANNWPMWRAEGDEKIRGYLDGDISLVLKRSDEYASYIIEAIEKNIPTVIYGNVLNTGLIDNLPDNGVVEVACLVDRRGVQPTYFGSLPAHLATLNQQHLGFHDLTAQAILEQDREAAKYALILDPLTAAVCSLEEIHQLFDEMISAQQPYLPEFLHR